MKKSIALLTTVALVALLALTVSASSNSAEKTVTYRDIKITLHGAPVTPTDADGNPTEPFIMDGTTYLPVRAIAGAMGLSVSWDDATNTVLLGEDDHHRVYITRTGSKYHYDPQCNGGTYWPVPFDTAVGMGLEPCDKCVLTVAHPAG